MTHNHTGSIVTGPASLFTRRHYVALATWLRFMGDAPRKQREAALVLTAPLADMLATDNPRFDRARFYAACKNAMAAISL